MSSYRGRRAASPAADDGFTLVEMLVVVVVIGILIAIAIPLYLHYKESAYVTSLKADLHTVQLAEERYRSEHDAYASSHQLAAYDPSLRMSQGTVTTVVWSSDSGYCIGGANSHGPGDSSAPFAAYGFPYKSYFFDSTTEQLSTNYCVAPAGATALDGGYFDQDGAH